MSSLGDAIKKILCDVNKEPEEKLTALCLLSEVPELEEKHKLAEQKRQEFWEQMEKLDESIKQLKRGFWEEAYQILHDKGIMTKEVAKEKHLSIRDGVLFVVEHPEEEEEE